MTLFSNESQLIQGLTCTKDYITTKQEQLLISQIDQQPWLADLKRRVRHCGYKYDYKAHRITPDLKIGALLDPVATLEATIATLKGNPSVDFDSLEKIEGKINGIQSILNSDDVNLDTVQELVNAIKTVETSLGTILVNDLTTGRTTKALTAEQGKVLKGLIDSLTSTVNALVVNTLAGNETDKAASVAAGERWYCRCERKV